MTRTHVVAVALALVLLACVLAGMAGSRAETEVRGVVIETTP